MDYLRPLLFLFFCSVLTISCVTPEKKNTNKKSTKETLIKKSPRPEDVKRYHAEKKDPSLALALSIWDGGVTTMIADYFALQGIRRDLAGMRRGAEDYLLIPAGLSLIPPLGSLYAGFYYEDVTTSRVIHLGDRSVSLFLTNCFAAVFFICSRFFENQPMRISVIAFAAALRTITGITQLVSPPFDVFKYNSELRKRYQISLAPALTTEKEPDGLSLTLKYSF